MSETKVQVEIRRRYEINKPQHKKAKRAATRRHDRRQVEINLQGVAYKGSNDPK